MKKEIRQIDWDKQKEMTFEAIIGVADENDIPRDAVADSIKDAIIKAYTRQFPESEIEVTIDIDNKIFDINKLFKVVDPYEDLNDYCEITLEDAKKKYPNITVGEVYREPVKLVDLYDQMDLGQLIQQAFKYSVTTQANKQIYNTWKPRVGTVIYAEVEKIDLKANSVTVNLGGNLYGRVGRQDLIPGEPLKPGEKYNFYIKEVLEQSKGWPIILSRADAGLVKYLISLNIPEVQERIIEIKDIARIAGFKTKLSVISHQASVEPAGTIIGPRGERIKNIQSQIFNEHIEVIEYDEDFKKYIINVCAPAEIAGFAITEPQTPEERRKITIVARNDKLALLIGKKGANVRLISEMLHCDIDINTIEEAQDAHLQYQKVDMQAINQQPFKKAYNKYRPNQDVLSGYNKVNRKWKTGASATTSAPTENADGTKKTKTSILEDFKGMSKEDILKELTDSNASDNTEEDIDDNY